MPPALASYFTRCFGLGCDPRLDAGVHGSLDNKVALGFTAGRLASVRHSSGFSLIELLVVMGIIGLVMAMGIGAFQSSSQTMGVTSSTGTVAGAVSAARQLAISKNCRTRFIIVTNSKLNPEDWQLSRYGVLRVKENKTDTGDEVEFELASRMDKLSTGVYFRENKHTSDENVSGGESMFDSGNLKTAKLSGKDIQYAYIEFLPTGGTSRPSSANIFEIEKAPSATDSIANNKNYVRLGVAQYTGRVKFERPDVN